MLSSWFTNLDKDKEGELKANFLSSLIIRNRLKYILSKKIEDSLKEGRSKQSYDSPNWEYMRADQNGYERALSEVIKLIE